MHQGRFTLGIRKNFTERVAGIGTGCSGKSLKKCTSSSWGHGLGMITVMVKLMVGLGNLKRFLPSLTIL